MMSKSLKNFGHHLSFEPTHVREFMCKVSQFIHKMNNLVKIKPLTLSGQVACMVYHEKQSVFPGGISAIT